MLVLLMALALVGCNVAPNYPGVAPTTTNPTYPGAYNNPTTNNTGNGNMPGPVRNTPGNMTNTPSNTRTAPGDMIKNGKVVRSDMINNPSTYGGNSYNNRTAYGMLGDRAGINATTRSQRSGA
jgi:hypothetical protein